jgi:hypothetical protein
MTEIASLLANYFPPQVLFTAIVVWIFSKLDTRTKDARAMGVRAHRRIDDHEKENKQSFYDVNKRVDKIEAE